MKFKVTLTLDVDFCEDGPAITPELTTRMESAVSEAITNAVQYAQGIGHNHAMAAELAILLDSPVTAVLHSYD